MIAEAIDLGVVTVGGMVAVIGVVAAGAWWAASISGGQTAIARDLSDIKKSVRETTRTHEDHRTETEARFSEQGSRLTRIEVELAIADRTPIRGIPLDQRPTTGPQERLRGDTPKPRRREDTGETGSGFER